jgi:hypothetical protein
LIARMRCSRFSASLAVWALSLVFACCAVAGRAHAAPKAKSNVSQNQRFDRGNLNMTIS